MRGSCKYFAWHEAKRKISETSSTAIVMRRSLQYKDSVPVGSQELIQAYQVTRLKKVTRSTKEFHNRKSRVHLGRLMFHVAKFGCVDHMNRTRETEPNDRLISRLKTTFEIINNNNNKC